MHSHNTDFDVALDAPAATRRTALGRTSVAAIACAVGAAVGFMAGAWSSQSAIVSQCRANGAAVAGEVMFDCKGIKARTTGFR